MSGKKLPQRSTRGQIPTYLRQIPDHKSKRKTAQVQPEEARRRQQENKMKSQHLTNLKNYPFGRAVHYFFPLDSFPRLEGHPSYAVDSNNALRNTFSKDKEQQNSLSFSSVLNRCYFGLPKVIIYPRKQNRCKNVAYSYLYELEDKKCQIDRQITTLRVILKSLKKEKYSPQFEKMDILKKDEQLKVVLDSEVSFQKKISLVEQKIQSLNARKDNNSKNWQQDDRFYFYHALNQQLHNSISHLKNYIQQQKVSQDFLTWISHQRTNHHQILYYYFDQPILQTQHQINCHLITAFHFKGGSPILEFVFQIIARKSFGLGETIFYETKEMVENLFGFQLVLKGHTTKQFMTFQKRFRKKCEEIKKYYISGNIEKQCPLLDNYVKRKNISISRRKEITGKQYLFLVIIFWISLGLVELQPTFKNHPDLLAYIASDYFPKVFSFIVEATQSPIVGMLCSSLESLADLFSKPDPFFLFPAKLLFQFNKEESVGLIFLEEIQSATEPSGHCIQQGIPRKKVKRS